MPTVLTVAAAQGGGRFGPFSGEVVIGSGARAQVLVGSAGVLPAHAVVSERRGGWSLRPGAPGATVTAWRSGRVGPVSGTVELKEGDQFALGGQDGVRFTVSSGEPQSASAAARTASRSNISGPVASGPIASGPTPRSRPAPRGPSGHRAPSGPQRGMPSFDAFADEARRQLEVEAMRHGPMQELQKALFRFRGGTFFQPRYIVAMLFSVAGGGFVACTGAAAALWAWFHAG